MNNILGTLLMILVCSPLWAEQAPDYKKMYKIKNDSVYSEYGDVLSVDSFARLNPEIFKQLVFVTENESKEKKEKDTVEKKGNFTSSWKFYTIMLAFPLFLILLFLLVFVRGKRKKE